MAEQKENVEEVEKSDASIEEIAAMTVKEKEFSWETLESETGLGTGYTKKEREELEKIYSESLTSIDEKSLIKGTVVSVTDRDVIVNIGFKSDGLVSRNEFRDLTDLKPGDEVEVFIETQEDKSGQLILSRKKARMMKAWDIVYKALDDDEILEGLVKRRTKGGLIVDLFGIECFLPGSQIDVKPIRDFDIYVGKKMQVKVVKINTQFENVVVSHKVLIEKDLEEQRSEIIKNLEKGQVLEGTIKNMTNFGVFIDLGGVDGLLHITDISWGRVNHPEEVLKLDGKVKVVVLDFDDDKNRISLGMKQLTSHPWDELSADIVEGSKVKGKIVNVADYGAFLEILPGVEGLIHVSEMSWSQHLRNPSDFMSEGDEVEAVVLTIDREERKMSLGIKQLTEDPWTNMNFVTKYEVGSRHVGVVRNLTNFGLFVEMEEGVDGLVHVSDLSWTKKIKHPSEMVKEGDKFEVVVLEIDVEERKLSLGHKQLEANPWDTYEEVFPIGSVHSATITDISEKGALVELQYGVEGNVSVKHLKKVDNSKAVVGETLDFKVIEFNKGEKKIMLSHSKTWEAELENENKKKVVKAKKAITRINNEAEKTTLGELDALSALKEQMESASNKKSKAAEEKVTESKKEEDVVVEEESSDDVTKMKFKNPETGRSIGYKKALEIGLIDEEGNMI